MINTVTIQGRLIRDAETKHTTTGTSVTSFTLANENGFGEHKKTLFIDCTAWKGAGETIAKYCTKGTLLIVSGTLNCREWTDKEGKKHKSYDINVTDFGFCEKARGDVAARPAPSFQTPVSGADFAELEDDDGSDLPF